MAKDPAFLFYPGDYLRDTQCLSEASQVAYDRIMCEHMRNICITQQQLKFFTKKLNDLEKEELMMTLKEIDGGYQIEWVAESICKRKDYSESRRLNRTKKHKNISSTYDKHMENENENENRNINEDREKGGVGEKGKEPNLPELHTQKYYEKSLDDDVWQEQVCRSTKKEPYQIPKLLEQFNADMLARQEYHPTIRDYRSHFVNWVKKSETETKKNKKSNAPLTIEHIASVVEQAKHIRVTLGNFDSPREDQVP